MYLFLSKDFMNPFTYFGNTVLRLPAFTESGDEGYRRRQGNYTAKSFPRKIRKTISIPGPCT